MAAPPDPLQAYRERLDPRVAMDIGAWASHLVPVAALGEDRQLEEWAAGPSEADLLTLEGLGERVGRWTDEDSKQAGFALATWRWAPGLAREKWFDEYRRVLGARVSTDVESQAAYRSSQLAKVHRSTAATWAKDRGEWTDRGLLPTVFTELDPEREAMTRAARHVAAARELRSRELGITVGPAVPTESTLIDDPFRYPLVYPRSPVADPEEAVARCQDELEPLRHRQRQVETNAKAVVDVVVAPDRESLDALQAKLATEMPEAAAVAADGRFPLPAGARDALRVEQEQSAAKQEYISLMGEAGELQWGEEPADPGRWDELRHEIAAQRAVVDELEADLAQRRAEGRDAGTWLASAEADAQTRGFAVHAVRTELELDRGRETERGSSGPDIGF